MTRTATSSPRALATVAWACSLVTLSLAAAALISTGTVHPILAAAAVASIGLVAVSQLTDAKAARARVRDLERIVDTRNADLESALEQLRDASRRQEEFVSHVSHELFTPLTTIVGAMSMLSEPGVADTPQMNSLVTMAARSSEQMTQRIEELMLATGLSGFVGTERAPFRLAPEIERTLRDFRPFDKIVATDLDADARAVGDTQRFRSALRHLLSNADKFAPTGSAIRVATHSDRDRVAVVITDEGPGILPEHREAVFERFRRFNDVDAARRHEGLGLGLFASRHVVRAMGGDVLIDDTPRGCAVRISLPAAGKRAAGTPRRTAAAAVAACLVFLSGAALAASGRMPGPVQDAVAAAARVVGIDLPRSDDRNPATVTRNRDDDDESGGRTSSRRDRGGSDAGSSEESSKDGDGKDAGGDSSSDTSDTGGRVGQQLEDTTGAARDQVGQAPGDVGGTVEDVPRDLERNVEDTRDDVGGAVEDTKDDLENKVDDLLP